MTVPPASSHPTGPARGADPLAAGTVIADRYEIVRRIGTGGMSTVYLARHREMDRPCALKVLHPRLSRDAEARDRFGREARNASRIHHANVATVFDFGTTTDGLVYLVMEYVEGRTLGALLAERQTLPARRVAALAEQIAAGLSAAHELGIVHRDLKPDNVMITGAGRESVKLVDFGIAKALEGSTAQDVTSEGVVVGTPEYMAPEQFAGDRVDHRSDIYSLGLVCYRMLTGRIPHRASSARETLSRRLTERPEPLGRSSGGVPFPAALEQLFAEVLARAPEDRPATALAFAGTLRTLVQGLPAGDEDQEMTVGLDAPTLIAERDTMATPRPRRWLWLVPGAVLAAALAVAFWPEPPSVLPAPAGDTTAMVAANPDTGTLVAPPPAHGPVTTPPVSATDRLPLPTPDEVIDPKLQDASRRRAEQIYQRAGDSFARRAQAAFIVASIHAEGGRFTDADLWTTRAMLVNDSAPAGAERDRRRDNYGNFQAQLRRRLQLSDPP